jgi:hypothetical protein
MNHLFSFGSEMWMNVAWYIALINVVILIMRNETK